MSCRNYSLGQVGTKRNQDHTFSMEQKGREPGFCYKKRGYPKGKGVNEEPRSTMYTPRHRTLRQVIQNCPLSRPWTSVTQTDQKKGETAPSEGKRAAISKNGERKRSLFGRRRRKDCGGNRYPWSTMEQEGGRSRKCHDLGVLRTNGGETWKDRRGLAVLMHHSLLISLVQKKKPTSRLRGMWRRSVSPLNNPGSREGRTLFLFWGEAGEKDPVLLTFTRGRANVSLFGSRPHGGSKQE